MGVYLDGAVDGAREETTSRDGETSDAALVSHQGLGTRHVLHVPHLHTGTNEERTKITNATKGHLNWQDCTYHQTAVVY